MNELDEEQKNKIKNDIEHTLNEHKYYVKGVKNVKNNKAVGSETAFNGIIINGLSGKDKIHMALEALIPSHIQNNDVVYLCIGTDRSTGDYLGPMVGTYLDGLGYANVYGTIDNPTHAMNLSEILNNL